MCCSSALNVAARHSVATASADQKEARYSAHSDIYPAPTSDDYCSSRCENRRPQTYSAGARGLLGGCPSEAQGAVAGGFPLTDDAGGRDGRVKQSAASDQPLDSVCPSVHGSNITELELSDGDDHVFGNYSFSKLQQQIGWSMGNATAAATAAAAAAAAAAVANVKFAKRDNLQAKAVVTVATMAVAASADAGRARGPTGVSLYHCAEQSGNYDSSDHDDEEDDISSLLQPGGSPCLPLEDGWALSRAAQREAQGSSGRNFQTSSAVRWLHRPLSASSNSSSSSSINSPDLNEGMDIAGPDIPASGGGNGNGEHLGQGRPRRAPPPPLSRHRACLLGYTDSAPAHSNTTAAVAPATRDVTLDFLRAPQTTTVQRQVPGAGTLSAPPGVPAAAAVATATATAAAAASRKLFTATETASPPSSAAVAVALGFRVLQPSSIEGEPPFWDTMRSLPERYGIQPAEKSCGMATMTRLPPPPSLPPRSNATPRSSKPLSAGLISRRALMTTSAVMAAAAAGAPPRLPLSGSRTAAAGSSLPHSCAAGSTISNISWKEGSDGGGLLGASLADGLGLLLEGLAAAGGDGGVLQECRASVDCATSHSWERELREPSGDYKLGHEGGIGICSVVKPVRPRGFGRGLLACFTGR